MKEEMNREIAKLKIEMNDGMFYTLKTLNKKAIHKYKELIDERDKCSYTYMSVINQLFGIELDGLMDGGLHAKPTGFNVGGNLIYLKEENKIINKQDIKQSLIQLLEPIESL